MFYRVTKSPTCHPLLLLCAIAIVCLVVVVDDADSCNANSSYTDLYDRRYKHVPCE
jgi:hypothetical protein